MLNDRQQEQQHALYYLNRKTKSWLKENSLHVFLDKIFQGDWIRKRFESPGIVSLDAEDKKTCLKRLIRSTGYDDCK